VDVVGCCRFFLAGLSAGSSHGISKKIRSGCSAPPCTLLATGLVTVKLKFHNMCQIRWNFISHHISVTVKTFFLTFVWPCIVTNFLIIKPTRCTNFSNLFWNENLHVSDSSSVHHQELFTVHSALVYVIQICRQLSSRIRMDIHPDSARTLSINLYDIYHSCVCSVKLPMMDRRTVQNR
jgi:hypothetical protein